MLVDVIETRTRNRMMGGFLIVSVLVHMGVLIRMAGLYPSEPVRYIEIELPPSEARSIRKIPSPPQPARLKATPAPRRLPPVRNVPVAQPDMPTALQKPKISPPRIIEPKIASDPQENPAPLASGLPPEATAAVSEKSVPESPADPAPPRVEGFEAYYNSVREQIQEHKRYPEAARRRRIQGQVAVQFVIRPDGRADAVSLAEPSKSRLLNEAALKAVHTASPFPVPPPGLFNGSVPLKIRIVFTLR